MQRNEKCAWHWAARILGAVLWTLLAVDSLSAVEVKVLVSSPDGLPIVFADVEAWEQGRRGLRHDWTVSDSGDGFELDLRPGDYQLNVAALGFAPYQGDMRVEDVPVTIRVALVPEFSVKATARHTIRARLLAPTESVSRLWVDLVPVFGTGAWTSRVEHNAEVRADGTFIFSDLRAGSYTLLVFSEEEDSAAVKLEGMRHLSQQLVHAELLSVNRDQSVTVDIGSTK